MAESDQIHEYARDIQENPNAREKFIGLYENVVSLVSRSKDKKRSFPWFYHVNTVIGGYNILYKPGVFTSELFIDDFYEDDPSGCLIIRKGSPLDQRFTAAERYKLSQDENRRLIEPGYGFDLSRTQEMIEASIQKIDDADL